MAGRMEPDTVVQGATPVQINASQRGAWGHDAIEGLDELCKVTMVLKHKL